MSLMVRAALCEDAAAIEGFLLSIDEFTDLIPGEERLTWNWLFASDSSPTAMVAERSTTHASNDASNTATPERKQIVGHYGYFALPYIAQNRQISGGVICKLAIDKTVRQDPIFMQLNLKTLKSATSAGVELLIGLINRKGLLEFHRAFGFKKIACLPVLAKPIRFSKLAHSQLPWPLAFFLSPLSHFAQAILCLVDRFRAVQIFGERLKFKQIERFEESEDFEFLVQKQASVFARRTATALNHRYTQTPFRNYQLFRISVANANAIANGGGGDDGIGDSKGAPQGIGYLVLRRMKMREFSVLAIVDLCFDFSNAGLARRILAFIDERARIEKVDLLTTITSNQLLESRLKSWFYLKTPESFDLIAREPKAKILSQGASTLSWFVNWYDSDHV